MFRARKFVEVPSKRSGGLLSPPHADLLAATGGTATGTAESKRQRLLLEAAEAYYHSGGGVNHYHNDSYQSQQHPSHLSIDSGNDGDNDSDAANVLVETPTYTITRGHSLPGVVVDAMRNEHERASFASTFPQFVTCRVSMPSTRGRSDCEALVYTIAVFRTHLLLWQSNDPTPKVLTLALPDELDAHDLLQPFLFTTDSSTSVSLLAIHRCSGVVLFWEDIALPYTSVPLRVQIPSLQLDERVETQPDALLLDEAAMDDSSSLRVLCWSNCGNVWEVALDDRRLRVRPFEKPTTSSSSNNSSSGLLSSWTHSVTSFFFANGTSSAPTNANGPTTHALDVHLPITSIQIIRPTPLRALDTSENDSETIGDDDETAELLVLFANGVVERRAFSLVDVVDGAFMSRGDFNVVRLAIAFFRKRFYDAHLASVHVIAIPYVIDESFGVLVAFVCNSSSNNTNSNSHAVVKYALFQFALSAFTTSTASTASIEPEWVFVLDYEPLFERDVAMDAMESDQATLDRRYGDVTCVAIARGAFYVVWPFAAPVAIVSIVLPRTTAAVSSQNSNVRSTTIVVEGGTLRRDCTVVGVGAYVETNAFAGDSVRGSVAFVLLDAASNDADADSGTMCVATATAMRKVEPLPLARVAIAPLDKSNRKRLELASRASAIDGPSSLTTTPHGDVHAFVRLLTTHFRDDPYAQTPLRIAPADALAIAQAAVAIDFQILDAKPSSGLRWTSNDDNDMDTASSKRHATDAHAHAAHVTPKLVRFQLEEKRTRRNEFVAFLQRRCPSVWHALTNSPELQRFWIEDDEKLHAAIALSAFQGALHAAATAASHATSDSTASSTTKATAGALDRRLSGQFLLHAIEKTVAQRGYEKEQLRLAGYNAFDIFYCEVSKLPELFEHLRAEVAALATTRGESDAVYLDALLEAGYSLLSMLEPPPPASSRNNASAFAPTGSWAFTRQARDVVLDQIARLSTLVLAAASSSSNATNGARWSNDDVLEATTQIEHLGALLLDAYARFLPSLDGEAAEDLRHEAEQSKRCVLNPLVHVATTTHFSSSELDAASDRKRSALFRRCVALCEQHAYYEGMVFLAATEDAPHLTQLDYVMGSSSARQLPKSGATKRLEAYCKAFDGFSVFVLRWYGGDVHNPWPRGAASTSHARSAMLAYLLAHSKLFGAALFAYVKDHDELSRLAWASAIAIDKYDDAAAAALRDAASENASLAKRKNLASLAKLAAIAAPETTRDNDATLQQSQRELVRVKIQEVLQQLPLAQQPSVVVDTWPLTCDELIQTCLDASAAVSDTSDPMRTSLFVLALDAIETLDTASPELDAALSTTWRHCLCSDEALWTKLLDEYAAGVSEHALEQLMRETLLFRATQQYNSRARQRDASFGSGSTAALTLELLDDLLEHEGHDDHAVLSVRSRQVLSKTLDYALTH